MANAGLRHALKVAAELERMSPDESVARVAQKAIRLLRATPMSVILDKVPGNNAIEKAKVLGVVRQTYYYWLNGTTRPSTKQAKRIAKLTDFSVDEIRGYAA